MTSPNSVKTARTKASFKAAILESMGTIHLRKAFTVLEAVAFKRSCQDAFKQNPGLKEVVLDFADTQFIDSSGIGALVICHKLCKSKSAQLRLINVPPQVMMALSLTELDKVFSIELAPPSALNNSPQNSLENLPETHPSVRSKAKRSLDILGALVGLALTAVLFVIVGIIIKLDDGGPIFFVQTRCSWMGKHFRIWKFRSMVMDAEARKHEVANKVEGPLFKNDNDPRITKIGRFLRRTSLDEFPQFWNVLKGDMSLVGTRPPVMNEVAEYEPHHWQRLAVKPGITGKWQTSGRSSIKDFEQIVAMDLDYQNQWSLWADIVILFKTVAVLFGSKDAC